MLWTLFRLLSQCSFSPLRVEPYLDGKTDRTHPPFLAPPTTKTLDIEWQRKTNEYMRSRNMNPITGISSENYGGTGSFLFFPSFHNFLAFF